MADVGTGTTITFGTSSFTAEVLNVNGVDVSRQPIDVTHMGSTGFREFIPTRLVDPGGAQVEILFDPNSQPPINQPAETITVTFPVPSGDSSGATLQFSGFVTDWDWGDPLEDKITANLTLKADGKAVKPTWTASS